MALNVSKIKWKYIYNKMGQRLKFKLEKANMTLWNHFVKELLSINILGLIQIVS